MARKASAESLNAKPTPWMPANGTTDCKMPPSSVKNCSAPERICDSISVSPPSWLFGKI